MVEVKGLPRTHVYGSLGESYTEGAPAHLAETAKIIDLIRSPVHLVFQNGTLHVLTRVPSKSLTPSTAREERFVIATEHDPKKTTVKDAIIRHFEAMGKFNQNTGNYTLNKAARPNAKLDGAYFDLANTKHSGKGYIGVTNNAPYDNVPLDEFIKNLKDSAGAPLHAETKRKILEAPSNKVFHLSLRNDNAIEHINALAQSFQEHIRQKPDEPFEAMVSRIIRDSSPRKTISVNAERDFSSGKLAYTDYHTGESFTPKPREPPAPIKKQGFFGSLFGKK